MRIRTMLVIAVLGAVMDGAPSAVMAACCAVNGGPCNKTPPLVHGVPNGGWEIPVCSTTLSGENCVAELDATVNVSSGSCITLEEGVTLDMKGYAFNCTSGACGTAITNTDSGGSSNKTQITNGDITGCWNRGINVTGGTNSTVTEMYIDLAGSCSGATDGISLVRGF